MLALAQMGYDGFVSTDSGILKSATEMVLLQSISLTFVVTDKVGDDALRSTGLLMANLEWIANKLEEGPRVYRLRPSDARVGQKATKYVDRLIQGSRMQGADVVKRELAAIGNLTDPVLPPDSPPEDETR